MRPPASIGWPSRNGSVSTTASISETTVMASPASMLPTASKRSATDWIFTAAVSTGIGGIEKPPPAFP
jgi:hypothetical protein